MSQSLRSPEELRDLAAARGFTAMLHHSSQPLPTAEAAAAALGVALAAMTKNIVCLVAGAPVLAIVAGDARVDDRALARRFAVGRNKVGLAKADQAFAITGFVVGCMPSFGHRAPLPALIDLAVAQLDRVYGGTGDPSVLISLPTSELLALTGGEVLVIARAYPAPTE